MVYSIRKWFNVMSNDLMETEVEVLREIKWFRVT